MDKQCCKKCDNPTPSFPYNSSICVNDDCSCHQEPTKLEYEHKWLEAAQECNFVKGWHQHCRVCNAVRKLQEPFESWKKEFENIRFKDVFDKFPEDPDLAEDFIDYINSLLVQQKETLLKKIGQLLK